MQDDSLILQMNEVWNERLQGGGDAIHVFVITTTTDVPSTNNPMDYKKNPVDSTSHTYENILGGWQSMLQASPEGLHIDLKSGKCAIPHTQFRTNCEAIKALISKQGTTCTFDGEPIIVRLVEEDPCANTTVIHMERTGA